MAVTIDDIKTVTVTGSVEIGRGIGDVASLDGYNVFVGHIDESQLEAVQEKSSSPRRKP